MNIVDYNSSDILKLEGNTSNSIAKAYVGYLFHLSGNLFEKEVILFTRDLWKGMAVSINLTGNWALLRFGVNLPIVVILRFHILINYYKNYQRGDDKQMGQQCRVHSFFQMLDFEQKEVNKNNNSVLIEYQSRKKTSLLKISNISLFLLLHQKQKRRYIPILLFLQILIFSNKIKFFLSNQVKMYQYEDNEQDQLQVLYEVQSIHNKRVGKDGKDQYQVKWKGFKEKTWEPVYNLQNLSQMIYKFNESQKSLRRQKSLTNHQTARKTPRIHKIHKEQNQQNQQGAEEKKTKRLRKESSKKSTKKLNKEAIQPQLQSKQVFKENEIVISQSSMVNDEDYQSDQGPRMKYTQKFDENLPDISELNNRPPNIYIDEVKRISTIEKRNDKWMVLVQFQEKFEDLWCQRDLIRLLFPEKLLTLYERLKKEKTMQGNSYVPYNSNDTMKF